MGWIRSDADKNELSVRAGVLAALVLALLMAGCAQSPQPQFGIFGSTHEHADFKMYINGAAVNFSQERYQTPEPPGGDSNACGNETTLAHLHGGDGNMVHKHATNVTWGYFFSTLNITMSDHCIRMDNGASFCDQGMSHWRYFVNNSEVAGLKDAEIHDLERVLLTYGSDASAIPAQLASVTSEAAAADALGYCGAPPMVNLTAPKP